MKVSVQYAQSHLTEMLPSVNLQDMESSDSLAAETQPSISRPKPRRGLWGAGKGDIWMADDFDSPQTNGEIAKLFNDGSVDPVDPVA